jgi:hypothetical protein
VLHANISGACNLSVRKTNAKAAARVTLRRDALPRRATKQPSAPATIQHLGPSPVPDAPTRQDFVTAAHTTSEQSTAQRKIAASMAKARPPNCTCNSVSGALAAQV